MNTYEDRERISLARQEAEKGTFKVVITHNGKEIGTLDKTFDNEFDAQWEGYETQIPDVNIDTEVKKVSESAPEPQRSA